jgi:hypothetical protein
MTDWKDLEGSGGLIEVMSWNLPGWTEENHKTPYSE